MWAPWQRRSNGTSCGADRRLAEERLLLFAVARRAVGLFDNLPHNPAARCWTAALVAPSGDVLVCPETRRRSTGRVLADEFEFYHPYAESLWQRSLRPRAAPRHQ